MNTPNSATPDKAVLIARAILKDHSLSWWDGEDMNFLGEVEVAEIIRPVLTEPQAAP